MLSEKQFLSEHAKKYAKLSPAEKKKRYADYVSTWTAGRPNTMYRTRTVGGGPPRQVMMQVAPSTVMVPHLSKCAHKYTFALGDPWDPRAKGSCVPDNNNFPSYKFSVFSRGVLTIGTLGDGFIAMRPFVPVNDYQQVVVTTPLYNTLGYNPAASTGIQPVANDSIFTTADTPGLEFRVVGAGIKVNYAGSEYLRGGSVILHRAPTGNNIPSGSLAPDLLRTRTTVQAPARRASEAVCYRPTHPADYGYEVFQGSPRASQYNLLIFVTGAPPGQSWYFETVTHFEALGNKQTPSPSHSDPVGMAAIQTAIASEYNSTDPPAQAQKSIEAHAKENLRETSGLLNWAADAMTTVASKAVGLIGGELGEAVTKAGINALRGGIDMLLPPEVAPVMATAPKVLRIAPPPPIRIDEIE